jgi:hypothetical protein
MPTVGPITTTTVPIVYDTDGNNLGGPADMTGPVVGNVTYRQEPDGSLVLELRLEIAQPSTSYTVYLVCGPSHDLVCGFVSLGTLSTDAVGSGSIAFTVPLADLQNPPFGAGYRNDHIDLVADGVPFFSAVVAGAINYFVCASREGLERLERTEFGARRGEAGDPVGARRGEAGDPVGARRGDAGDPHAGAAGATQHTQQTSYSGLHNY